MLDFLPYFQIVIGLYISFCFEKLIQSLLWSEGFTKGLTSFYHDWSTLAWHKEKMMRINYFKKESNSLYAVTFHERKNLECLC